MNAFLKNLFLNGLIYQKLYVGAKAVSNRINGAKYRGPLLSKNESFFCRDSPIQYAEDGK